MTTPTCTVMQQSSCWRPPRSRTKPCTLLWPRHALMLWRPCCCPSAETCLNGSCLTRPCLTMSSPWQTQRRPRRLMLKCTLPPSQIGRTQRLRGRSCCATSAVPCPGTVPRGRRLGNVSHRRLSPGAPRRPAPPPATRRVRAWRRTPHPARQPRYGACCRFLAVPGRPVRCDQHRPALPGLRPGSSAVGGSSTDR